MMLYPMLGGTALYGLILVAAGFHFFIPSSHPLYGILLVVTNWAISQLECFGLNAPCMSLEPKASRICQRFDS